MIYNKRNILVLLEFISRKNNSDEECKIIVASSTFKYVTEIFEEFSKNLDSNWKIRKDINQIIVSNSNNKLKFLFLPLGDGSVIRGYRANLILIDDRQLDLEVYKTIETSLNTITKNPVEQENEVRTKNIYKFPKYWKITYDYKDYCGYYNTNSLMVASFSMEEAINILKQYCVIKNQEIKEVQSCELTIQDIIFRDN